MANDINIDANITFLVKELENYIDNPNISLPEEIFLFVSRITPMVNVDLLIKDENNRTLLSWRDDKYSGKGWHIPGGMLRIKETLENRVQKVAITEIGTNLIVFDHTPIKWYQTINEQTERCHFISFLYRCHLPSSFVPDNKNLKCNDPGFLKWHNKCPDNLLITQKIYSEFI
jgi:colanic acid biosynthesis protein WcaH